MFFSGGGPWVTQATALYNSLVEKLSAEEMDKFVEEMVSELAERRPEMDRQEFKITKTALKQVQDLVSLQPFFSSFLLMIPVCRQQPLDEPMST
jgi:polyhydroxyalkanoate synthesis regulator phasin